MAWFLSVTSVAMLWFMGNKSIAGPIIGIANQFLWVYYAISIQQYGLIPGAVAFLVVHVRNLILWRRNETTS